MQMRKITYKQLRAIHNLLHYVNREPDYQPHNHKWQYKLSYANKIVKNGSVENWHSTSYPTQNLIKFLINGMEYIESKVPTNTGKFPGTEWDRIQGESVCSGYWDNPLF